MIGAVPFLTFSLLVPAQGAPAVGTKDGTEEEFETASLSFIRENIGPASGVRTVDFYYLEPPKHPAKEQK
jgi:hypothetical protein